jgi:hypothetical protein
VGPGEAGPAAASEAGAGCCPVPPGSCACVSGPATPAPSPLDGRASGLDLPAAGSPAVGPPGFEFEGGGAEPADGAGSEAPAAVPWPVVPGPAPWPEAPRPIPGSDPVGAPASSGGLTGGAGRGWGAAAGAGPASYAFWRGAQEASHKGSVRQNAATAVVSGLTPQLDFMTAPHSLPRHVPYLNVTAGRRAGERCPGVSLAAAQSRIGCGLPWLTVSAEAGNSARPRPLLNWRAGGV